MINTTPERNIIDTFAQISWQDLSIKTIQSTQCPTTFTVNYPTYHHRCNLSQQIQKQLGLTQSQPVTIRTQIERHKPQGMLQPLKKIKNIIAICANKGGVGKSTIATNIAASLAQGGHTVGLLDADLYGPNQPELLGINSKALIENNQYQPIQSHGISLMSMGVLVDEKTPLVWRGPMASNYFQQMVFNTNWPALDYLILDCPPGTGDILLTMTQKVPIAGVVLVHTPQCLSISDAIKGIHMLRKMQVPILGAIENMAGFRCVHCDQINHIFPETMADQLQKLQIEQINQIPLSKALVDSSEMGKPLVCNLPNDSTSLLIHQIATQIAARLACRPISTRNISTHTKQQTTESITTS
ncbi:MAG: ATPase [Legionellales bacterium]|nr:ATPase [Legionellales bacterium]